ncbi:50S ribosomal protein L10 [archaeon]|nr:MAG: 50S ribosomal protein L10 [archaeon]RLG65109.1 MAG: 50S ribosomal protein L10 [archaeon]RLG66565.1 MAG: 50S ribosomal protein L10 [archaeon]HDM24276.1 50S ribosomal protein L10 [Candidatus Bathyarchaeota archaeon]
MAVALTKQGRRVHPKKIKIVQELMDLIKKYKVVAVASIYGIKSSQLHEIRKKLRGWAKIKVSKNTLMKIAFENLEKNGRPNLSQLAKYLEGPSAIVCTNVNPFKLASFLRKNRVKAFAKAGDIAPEDIIIRAGNTGLAPGPVLSEFKELGIPTRIESGTIWIAKDTLVVRKGEPISEKLAIMLSRLNIKPIESELKLNAAYEDGVVIPSKDLYIDVEKYRKQLEEAVSNVFKVAVNIGYEDPSILRFSIPMAYQKAMALALAIDYISRETLPELIKRAYAIACALDQRISKGE